MFLYTKRNASFTSCYMTQFLGQKFLTSYNTCSVISDTKIGLPIFITAFSGLSMIKSSSSSNWILFSPFGKRKGNSEMTSEIKNKHLDHKIEENDELIANDLKTHFLQYLVLSWYYNYIPHIFLKSR